jgi:hypothetical protein
VRRTPLRASLHLRADETIAASTGVVVAAEHENAAERFRACYISDEASWIRVCMCTVTRRSRVSNEGTL